MTSNLSSALRRVLTRPQAVIAVVLLAAALVVPFALRDRGEDPPAATTPPTAQPATADAAAVALDGRPGVTKTIGKDKDPFEPRKHPHAAAKDEAGKPGGSGSTAGKVSGGSSGPTSSASAPAAAAPAPAPTATAPTTPAPTPTPAPSGTSKPVTVFQPVLRHGYTTGELSTGGSRRLATFPRTRPVAQLLGLTTDRDAVFIVTPGTTVGGDGECAPSAQDCRRLVLDRGDTAFLTRAGREYRLELLDVSRRSMSATLARRARTATAPHGREVLRSLLDRVGDLRYSERTGTVG